MQYTYTMFQPAPSPPTEIHLFVASSHTFTVLIRTPDGIPIDLSLFTADIRIKGMDHITGIPLTDGLFSFTLPPYVIDKDGTYSFFVRVESTDGFTRQIPLYGNFIVSNLE